MEQLENSLWKATSPPPEWVFRGNHLCEQGFACLRTLGDLSQVICVIESIIPRTFHAQTILWQNTDLSVNKRNELRAMFAILQE